MNKSQRKAERKDDHRNDRGEKRRIFAISRNDESRSIISRRSICIRRSIKGNSQTTTVCPPFHYLRQFANSSYVLCKLAISYFVGKKTARGSRSNILIMYELETQSFSLPFLPFLRKKEKCVFSIADGRMIKFGETSRFRSRTI